MDIENHVLLIKDEDKTSQVVSCELHSSKWRVIFETSSNAYEYQLEDIYWASDPRVLDLELPHQLCINGIPQKNVEKVLDFGKYVRLIYHAGQSRICKKSEISTQRKGNILTYFFRVAEIITHHEQRDFDGSGEPLLLRQYGKLTQVDPQSSLQSYLSRGRIPKRALPPFSPVFPFGINNSQRTAARKALRSKLSVIEGPPGTGKTQTILNIVANLVMAGKKVAVVAGSTPAVTNVVEKLRSEELDVFAAHLGKSDKSRELFFNSQSGSYPDFSEWQLEEQQSREIQKHLSLEEEDLTSLLEQYNTLAVLQEQLQQLEVQKTYFMRMYRQRGGNNIRYASLRKHDAQTILQFWAAVDYEFTMHGKISPVAQLNFFIKFGVYSFSFYSRHPNAILLTLQKMYLEREEADLRSEVSRLKSTLKQKGLSSLLSRSRRRSISLFKGWLADYYSVQQSRKIFKRETYQSRDNFQDFLTEYPAILTTTRFLPTCVPDGFMFDYIIMDEAAQVDLVTGTLALSYAKNAVIVGDSKQLTKILPDRLMEQVEHLTKSFNVPESFNFVRQSLLSSITTNYPHIQRTFLREQYRCHPKIIGFCNRKYYNNKLIPLVPHATDKEPLVIHRTRCIKGAHNPQRSGRADRDQLESILGKILPHPEIAVKPEEVGILSPYRMEGEMVRVSLEDAELLVDNVEKFQGREREIIMLSTIATQKSGIEDDPHLLNVAVSRAKSQLIVVVEEDQHFKGADLGELLDYIDFTNCRREDSRVYAVFDLLHSRYEQERQTYCIDRRALKDQKILYRIRDLIIQVLRRQRFRGLSKTMHYSLSQIVHDTSRLNPVEIDYALHSWNQVDFVIYREVDKTPLLCIEVDTHGYRAGNSRHPADGSLKDSILLKCNVPLIRFEANGRDEERRLAQELDVVVALHENQKN